MHSLVRDTNWKEALVPQLHSTIQLSLGLIEMIDSTPGTHSLNRCSGKDGYHKASCMHQATRQEKGKGKRERENEKSSETSLRRLRSPTRTRLRVAVVSAVRSSCLGTKLAIL